MKFSLRFKSHDSIIKAIIGVMVVVATIIIANIIIIMNMIENDPEPKKDNKPIPVNDFMSQSKLNPSKNDIFLLK